MSLRSDHLIIWFLLTFILAIFLSIRLVFMSFEILIHKLISNKNFYCSSLSYFYAYTYMSSGLNCSSLHPANREPVLLTTVTAMMCEINTQHTTLRTHFVRSKSTLSATSMLFLLDTIIQLLFTFEFSLSKAV